MIHNPILAIDTSCDETSASVTCGRRVLSNVISSQINIHKKYGGVFPALAKRAHGERIDHVVEEALRRGLKSATTISAIAVTHGPGLAIALEVGIKKAKELSTDYGLPLIAINHMEGHVYSCLAQNAMGNPKREIVFPALCLLVSGGHTELILMTDHGKYKVLGSTLDDACGEALDKAAKILKLGYPGGPIIERLAEEYINKKCEDRSVKLDDEVRSEKNKKIPPPTSISSFPPLTSHFQYLLSRPLKAKNNLNFSYSGLKTQFLYLVNSLSGKEFNENLLKLAASFQSAAFEQAVRKTANAISLYNPKTLLCGGGVMANKYLRLLLRKLAKENNLPVLFPPSKKLIGDNAAMIGVAAFYKLQRKEFIEDIEGLNRKPRLTFDNEHH